MYRGNQLNMPCSTFIERQEMRAYVQTGKQSEMCTYERRRVCVLEVYDVCEEFCTIGLIVRDTSGGVFRVVGVDSAKIDFCKMR